MSEQFKSGTVCKSSTGNVFSQLRHLASEVENSIEHLQQDLGSSKITSDSNDSHALAINFLLHTKKDITQLKSDATAKVAEFSKGNRKISRVHELMKSVVDIQSQRLDNVESYLEKYGYKRHNLTSEEKSNNDAVKKGDRVDERGDRVDESDRNNCADDKSDIEDDDDDTSDKSDLSDGDESPETPTTVKQPKTSFIRTPRLEDLFKDLSEESIYLIKQRGKDRPQVHNTTNQITTMKENTCSISTINNTVSSSYDTMNQTRNGTPEPPTLLTNVFSFNNYDKTFEPSKLNNQQFETSKFDSRFDRTPEMPKALTQVIELGSMSKAGTTGQNTTTCFSDLSSMKGKITDMPRTPETPTLLTGLFTFNSHAGKFESSKANDIAPTGSPESPKLATPGFKLNRFSEAPDLIGSQLTRTTIMKTPEAPTYLLSRFEQNIPYLNPTDKVGRSARSLFNTPPMPELTSHTTWRNDAALGNKENFQSSLVTSLPTHKEPKQPSRDADLRSHFGYRGTIYKK